MKIALEDLSEDAQRRSLPPRDDPASGGARQRILHVFAPAPYGGLEQVVGTLASEQLRSGHDVHVAAILDEGAEGPAVLQELAERGVGVHTFPLPPRAYRRERAQVRRLCQRLAPSIMHTHGYRADVLHGSVARELGVGSVATAHGFIGGGWKGRVYERLQCRAYRTYGAVVAVSRPLHEELASRGVPLERLHCVRNGWTDQVDFLDRASARRELGIAEDGKVVGFVGRVGPEKGADVFIEAFARLRGAPVAVVAGDGRLRTDLERRTHILGTAARTHWLGVLRNAGRFMKAFDVFVLSSRTEGTPMVLLEAMAAGVPVVATRVGGIPDVVTDNEARLVDAEQPDALADAVDEVLENGAEARRRAVKARERLDMEFGADRWRQQYDRVYSSARHALPAMKGEQ